MWEHCSNSSLCCLRSLRWTKPEYYIFGGNWLFLRAHLAASGLQWTSMYCFRRTEASCRTGRAPSLCGANKVIAGKSRCWVISNVDKISSEEHDKQWNLKCELCKVEAKLIGHFKRLHLFFRSASRHLGFNFTSWSSWASSTQSPRHKNLILARSRTTWSVAIKPPMVSMRAALRPESAILSASDLDWKFSLLNRQVSLIRDSQSLWSLQVSTQHLLQSTLLLHIQSRNSGTLFSVYWTKDTVRAVLEMRVCNHMI